MKTKDPVCGMDIDTSAAFAVEQREGHSYYLCSASCCEKFRADPARYAAPPQPAASGIEGQGAHGCHRGHGCC